jgi:hypothetical protein
MHRAKEKGIGSVHLSPVHPLLIAAPLLWFPILFIYRNDLVPPLSTLAGHYWTVLSWFPIEDWLLRVLPPALPVLDLIVATLVILREQL